MGGDRTARGVKKQNIIPLTWARARARARRRTSENTLDSAEGANFEKRNEATRNEVIRAPMVNTRF